MLKIGQKEADAAARVIKSGSIFRYKDGGECHRFEQRYAEFLKARYVLTCASGTTALQAALASLGVGPGDEVLVPAHTYMATAMAVVNVGAIPVVVDIDDSIMICPEAIDDAVGPRTKAVIPVHMWGHICDMTAIMRIARKHKLLVIEDCCQAVGGACGKRMVGTFGNAGCFSFNYFKNMTCGEAGAVISKTKDAHNKVRNLVDSCGFFWEGKQKSFDQFCGPSARVSDIQGAMLNVQLDRLPKLIDNLRRNKQQVLDGTASSSLLQPAPLHSPDGECATTIMYQLPTTELAASFAETFGCAICSRTGRHTFTEWEPILNMKGHIHPALDPFKMSANKKCRMNYSKDMLPDSMDLLQRTIMVGNNCDYKAADVKDLTKRLNATAAALEQA